MTVLPADTEPFERRTYCRVRRRSKDAARPFIAPLSKTESGRRRHLVRRYAVTTQQANKRDAARGCLSTFAVALYDTLCGMAVKFRGMVEPSLHWLARELTGKRTRTKRIHRALCELRDHGLIEWDRRYVPTGREGVRGPQVEQTTNLYRILDLPKRVFEALRKRPKAPPPDDHDHAAAAGAALNADHAAREAAGELADRRAAATAVRWRAMRPGHTASGPAAERRDDRDQHQVAADLRARAAQLERESHDGRESPALNR